MGFQNLFFIYAIHFPCQDIIFISPPYGKNETSSFMPAGGGFHESCKQLILIIA
jgi:hypothetical protein